MTADVVEPMIPPADAAAAAPGERLFLGHPVGLAYLAFAEAWERFSYSGMQTLLVLYMASELLLPGHVEHVAGFAPFRRLIESGYGPLPPAALASAIFGLYAGLVYLTPIFGGLVADRWLGKTRTVTIGALMMVAGHFLMAFEGSFLLALVLLIVGVGGFKGNIAAQVGDLYRAGDPRRADAFQLYYLGINVAVVASPLVCGTLGEVWGWRYGFAAAGVGMLVGLTVYLAGRRYFPPEAAPSKIERAAHAPMAARDRRRVLLLVALLPVVALSMVGNQEIFNVYVLWGQRTYDFALFGFRVPVTWLISLDAAAAFASLSGSIAFWRWWATRRRVPSEISRMAGGTLISAAAFLIAVLSAVVAHATGHRIGLWWAVALLVVNEIGFANVMPVGLSLYSRAAPGRLQGTMVSLFYVPLFAANLFVGWLGGWLGRMPDTGFWLVHAALVGVAGLAFMAARWGFGGLLAAETEGRG